MKQSPSGCPITKTTRPLILDEQTLEALLQGWPLIQITGKAGIPPEIYRFTYNLSGLCVSGSGEILEPDSHLMEVNLSLGYPRRAPQCRMLTPVFHPNFDDSMVCIGDFWAASEGLDDLIIRIGRMIAYQEYNTKSPLNGLAAKWAAQNSHLLPIDPRPVAPPLKYANAEATQLESPTPTIAATPRLQSWRRSLGGEDRHRLRKLIFRLSTTMDLEIAFLLDRSEFFKSQVEERI